MRLTSFLALIGAFLATAYAGTFLVDYANHQFLKDGQPFRYISGSIHYMRVHPDYWNDRLQRIRALGLNVVQVYVPWNLHEPVEGTFDFSGGLNISHFLTLAQQNDLHVLLRPGPYICAEWEYGGLPWWLLKYTSKVQAYYNVLLDQIKPHLYKNGGPILMVQVENEYGVLGACDHNYTAFLRDLIWGKVGNDTVLYNTDQTNDRHQSCGHVDGALATIDFGPTSDFDLDINFDIIHRHNNGGPTVCSEFWVDWFCSWGGGGLKGLAGQTVADNVHHMYYDNNASFNVYMIHGGTNFGFMIITSYDYGAAVKENGATNVYYQAIYDFIKGIPNWPSPPLAYPTDPPASNYGPITMSRLGSGLIQTLQQILETCQNARDPLTFEQINHGFGYVLYTNTLAKGGTTLTAPNIRDYGYVFINNNYQGMLTRDNGVTLTLKQTAQAGDTLRILVENRGRDNYWNSMYPELEFKGLQTSVTLDNNPLKNWYACGVNLTEASVNTLTGSFDLQREDFVLSPGATSLPGVYVGQFSANPIQDTWFDSTGWGKGQLFVNGFNLGRYWPSKGPQVTLYVPKPILKPKNIVLIIELIGSQMNQANFIDHTIGHYN